MKLGELYAHMYYQSLLHILFKIIMHAWGSDV